MEKPDFHFFVCNSFRAGGESQGICNKKGAVDLIQYLESELADRGMSSFVTSTGCLKVCDRGPAMVVYPKGDWYGNLGEEAIDEILDAMEEGSIAEKYLLT
ncbi:MAG: (2Fe-2S) ferredoxin domain-containing protein [Candidatus Omnitrophica bacterium]|nr:(2Fe-2S) ferredoxin domain-containing protein [Candidatus Omnitrophota bacterium]